MREPGRRPLMSGFGIRTVLVPDLGDELARTVAALDGLLLSLRTAEREGAARLPGALAGGVALVALRRLWRSLAPTQGRGPDGGRLFGPGGRTEYVPLHLVDVDPIDIAALSAAAAALGAATAGGGPVLAALDAAGPAPASGGGAGGAVLTGAELVTGAARLSGLLDLADTAESVLLRERLAAAGPGADVVLTPGQDQAYRATAARMPAMWPRA
jgi:hypothetical protein